MIVFSFHSLNGLPWRGIPPCANKSEVERSTAPTGRKAAARSLSLIRSVRRASRTALDNQVRHGGVRPTDHSHRTSIRLRSLPQAVQPSLVCVGRLLTAGVVDVLTARA